MAYGVKEKTWIVNLPDCHLSSRGGVRCRLPRLTEPYSVTISFAESTTLNVKSFQAEGFSTKSIKEESSSQTEKKFISGREDRYVEATVVKYLPNLNKAPTVEDYNGGKIFLPDAAEAKTIEESQLYFFGQPTTDYTAILDLQLPQLKGKKISPCECKSISGSVPIINTRFIDGEVNFNNPLSLTFVGILKYLAV